MEMNWSTFVLEILNFLILVWILKHFLYQPVLDVIARRKAGVEKTLDEAKKLHAEADKLREQYEGRLADWESEKRQARDALAQEMSDERIRKIEELKNALEQEKEKIRVAEERRQRDVLRKMEETALQQGARFAGYLLEKASGQDTEKRLVELVISELPKLPDERITSLKSSLGQAREGVLVLSAYPLPDDLCQRLKQVLATITGTDTSVRFELDQDLLAGLQIIIGEWVLGANLRDELKGFASLAHAE